VGHACALFWFAAGGRYGDILHHLHGVHSYWELKRKVDLFVDSDRMGMRLWFHEHKLLDSLHLQPERVRGLIYLSRITLIGMLALIVLTLRGLALLLFGAVWVTVMFDQAYKNVIYESGITNIGNIMNFINFFVPHINSGNSADQSLLEYVAYSKDADLAEFYERKSDPEYRMQKRIRQMVDIYDIAKYNEEKGISDYTYILNEISQDYSQKQVYYNSFISRIGEIKPIMLSYYFGVPMLIISSFGQTFEFWMGPGGVVVAIITLILFSIFKYLIYKLQKDTVNAIF